ncbi:unnamed protein product [Calypogeia fissa]
MSPKDIICCGVWALCDALVSNVGEAVGNTLCIPLRAVARLPVAGFLWFLALLIPFFGPLNSIVGALFMSFSTFMIPCVAYVYVFWSPEARQNAAEKMSKFLPRWKDVVVVNFLVVVTTAVLGTGFGSYASVSNIKNQIKTFGLFQKCYQCT